MISAISPLDPFRVEDVRRYTAHPAGNVFPPIFNDAAGRTLVHPAVVPSERTAVIVIMGQSNSGNHCGTPRASTSSKVHNFNYLTGGMYVAADPLLGGTGTAGAYGTYLGDKLISAGKYDRVVLATMAIGAAIATDFSASGPFAQNIKVMARRLGAVGLEPTMICYQQGESDNAEGTPAATITAALRSMVDVWRGEGVTAPVFIALTSTWPGYTNNAQVRLGQTNSWSSELGIYAGPDTDTIGAGGRDSGGLHFNNTGSDQHAALWQSVIQAHFGL